MTTTVVSRFTIQDYPHAAPGKCVLCGGNTIRDGRKYVDFGMSVPAYGAVYMCTVCVKELAHILGYIEPEEARRLDQEIHIAHSQLTSEVVQNERLRIALSNLDFLGTRHTFESGPDFAPQGKNQDDSGLEPEQGTDSERDDNESKHTAKRRKEGEEGPIESPDVRGLAHLLDSDPSSLANSL